MNAPDTAREVEDEARELKWNGNLTGALVLRKRLELMLNRVNAPAARQATNLNWRAFLAICVGDLSEAERAARRTLLLYRPVAGDRDERLATYVMMLACALAERRKFSEATAHAEEAIAMFRRHHGADSQFVKDREAAIARMRIQDTHHYIER